MGDALDTKAGPRWHRASARCRGRDPASASYMIRGIRGDKVGQFSEAVTVYLGKTPMNGEGGGEGGLSLAA